MITSTANPRVRYARSLLRRRTREREKHLTIEGLRLIEDAWRAGLRPAFLFGAPDLMDPDMFHRLESLARSQGVEWLPCSRSVIASLSDTATPQGLVGVFPFPRMQPPTDPTLLLLLDRVRDPGNVGTSIRAAAAAGAEGVIVLPGAADPWNPKALRAGMGAHFRIPVWRPPEPTKALDWIGSLPIWLADARAAVVYDSLDWTEPVVLAIGGEAEGASQWTRQHAVATIAIPMSAGSESLNAAMAAAVILFEAARQRRRKS